MSASIAIPSHSKAAKRPHRNVSAGSSSATASISNSSSSSTSSSSSSFGMASASSVVVSGVASSSVEASPMAPRERRISLLGSSLSKAEHIVVDVGHPDAPRLISCVRSSQGFDWNRSIFLPRYADHDPDDLEQRRDPIDEIILTDEEARDLLPH